GDLASALGEEGAARARGLSPAQARWLVSRYGSRWSRLFEGSPWGTQPLGEEGIPLAAEVAWAVRQEHVRTLSDLLLRFRLPEIVADEEAAASMAARLLGELAGWSAARTEREWRRWRRERRQMYGGPEAGRDRP
ncbi:MAG: hypothetical protein D6718_01905, partial [Acidobacteria bacterium]